MRVQITDPMDIFKRIADGEEVFLDEKTLSTHSQCDTDVQQIISGEGEFWIEQADWRDDIKKFKGKWVRIKGDKAEVLVTGIDIEDKKECIRVYEEWTSYDKAMELSLIHI